jgi:thioredoxin reductase (NADPH)
MHDVIVIGSGPAGLNAALYTSRASLDTLVVSGPQVGGQLALTWEIDNYLGFVESPSGADLTDLMVKHIAKFGARLEYDEVTSVDFTARPLTVTTYSGKLEAQAVIIASGASATKLGVPGEDKLIGHGVSYCATCDGAFFKNDDVVVVGGGDSAVEEALFLTRFAKSVRVIHRRDELRAGPQLQERAFANDKIEFIWDTVVDEVVGNGHVSSVKVHNAKSGEKGELEAQGIFIFIGHYPNSNLFRGAVDMDDHGYVQVDERMRTSVAGVFAAGEIMDPNWRQVATSVGQGCMAAMAVEDYLAAL